MYIKKVLLLINIFLISFLGFFYSHKTTYAATLNYCPKSSYFDLRKFTFHSPAEIFCEGDSSENLKDNFVPCFASNQHAYDGQTILVKDEQEKINKKVFGTVIINENTNKYLNDKKLYSKCNTTSQKIDNTKYYKIDTDYQNYTCLKANVPGDWISSDKYNMTFYAGFKSISNSFFDSLPNIIKIVPIYQSIITNLVDEKNTSKINQIEQYALGACYTIKPQGENIWNECYNATKNNCDSTKNNTYFAYGISCENLNSLILDSDYRAKIQTAQIAFSPEMLKYLNSIKVTNASKTNRNETLFKAQIPFGDIKDGISLNDYVNAIYKYLITFASILTALIFVLGGLSYLKGDPKKGKSLIQNSLIGFVLLLSSYSLLKFINPNVLNLSNLDLTDVKQEMIQSNDIIQSDDNTPDLPSSNWYKISNTNDPFNFQIAPPINLNDDKLASVALWNTHYYTLFGTGSTNAGGSYKYALTDNNSKALYYTNKTNWCRASMEGSLILVVNNDLHIINVSENNCSKTNAQSAFNGLSKTELLEKDLNQIFLNSNCGTPPVYKASNDIPKCSWWYTHTNSLWQKFKEYRHQYIFGGAGRGGGSLIPLRSIAISSNSILKTYLNNNLFSYNNTNLLVYIPDARGKKLIAPDGSIIIHDGYFWLSDSGGLSSGSRRVKSLDGTQVRVSRKEQIDIFTGTVKQKILDGEELHKAYIISCGISPGKEICEKFHQKQIQGYPNIKIEK